MSKLNGIKVVWFTGSEQRRQYGTLTTESAASSYGLPVVVDESGAALGAAEVSELLVLGAQGNVPGCQADESGYVDAADLYRRAEMAGYRFQTA